MTDFEIRCARLLVQASMLSGIPAKRFAKDLALAAEYHPEKALTLRQRSYLQFLVWRYRRQLAPIDREAVQRCKPPHLLAVRPGDAQRGPVPNEEPAV